MASIVNAPRIVCVGSNLESDIALRGIVEHGVNVVGLVTRPKDRRGNICDYVDLHSFCREQSIATIDTLDINSSDTLNSVAALRPDYIFTLGTSQLFKKEFLSLPSQWAIGSHPSPLPQGRGRAPVPWTILQALQQSAVSFFRMDTGADTGDLLLQRSFAIPPRAYAMDVYNLVAENLRDGFCDLYDAIVSDNITLVPQDAAQSSYRSRRGPADGFIDFVKPAIDVDRLVRAISHPYPGAYVYYNDRKIEVWRVSLDRVPNNMGSAGQILASAQDQLLVQAGDQPIWLSDFSHLGEPVDISEFRVGKSFNYRIQDEIHALRAAVADLQKKANLC